MPQEEARERKRAETTPLRNEAQLNCVSLRSQLDCEVIYGAVKGQDERPLRGALDSPVNHHRTVYANGGKQIKKGRHVGLDFYDLLIEALKTPVNKCNGDISPIILTRYNVHVARHQAKLLLLLLATSTFLEAQEVRVVDLLNVNQRTELRFPPAPSDCISGEPCVGSGVGGLSVGDGAPDPRDPRALGVALDCVTPTGITLDAFEAEFRLLNTGLAPINVPVWPHLSDLQPSSESQPFSYLSIALQVHLSGTGPEQGLGIGWVQLYGSAEHEDTIIALKPGEWIRVKAKLKLRTRPTKPMQAQLRGDFWVNDNVYKPQVGGGFTEAVNVYPRHTLFPAIQVHFSPTRNAAQESHAQKP